MINWPEEIFFLQNEGPNLKFSEEPCFGAIFWSGSFQGCVVGWSEMVGFFHHCEIRFKRFQGRKDETDET